MKNNVLKWLGRVGATLLTTIVILVVGLYLVMAMLACNLLHLLRSSLYYRFRRQESLVLWLTGSVHRKRLI